MSLAKEIREFIIRPALKVTDMWSESAELLVYGTGMVESRYEHIMQVGNPKGGAYGVFQQQNNDFQDAYIWLRNGFCKGMLDRILAACYYATFPTDPSVLASNIKFAALMCRAHYWRVKAPIPKPDDAAGLANYHVKYYNCGGKANADINTKIFQQIIDGEL